MYLNSVTIVGNITRDPVLRTLPDGSGVASFGIAVNENYKDKSGNKVESVEFVNCVAWGKAGELIHQYMKKGSHILVQGKLKTSSWEKEGVKQYKTEVVVRDFKFGRKSAVTQYQPEAEATEKQPAPKEELPTVNHPDDDIDPELLDF